MKPTDEKQPAETPETESDIKPEKTPTRWSVWRQRLRKQHTAMLRRIEYDRLRRIRRQTVPKYVHCKNCGTRLEGMYCHRCGQYALDTEQPFWKYIKQYFENVYQFDSKVWQTLWLLFRRPGLLTREFNAGKINSYVHPLRLFMFISALFFLAVAFFIPEADQALKSNEKQLSDLKNPMILNALKNEEMTGGGTPDRDTVVWVANARTVFEGLEALVEVQEQTGSSTLQVRLPAYLIKEEYLVAVPRDSIFWSNEDPQRPAALFKHDEVQQLHREMIYAKIIGWFSQWLPVILLLFIPLFALLLKGFFHRSRMHYMGHFVTARHLHSVQLILIFTVLLGGQWIDHTGNYALLLLLLYLLHMIFAFHRIYGESWGKTAVKALLLHGLYILVMASVLFALIIWLLLPLMQRSGW